MCIFIARYIMRGENIRKGQGAQNKKGNPIRIGKNVYYEDNGGDWVF